MRRHVFLLCLGIMSILSAFAKDEVTVEGKYDFVLPSTMSEAEGKETALNRAIIQALADEFGTIVTSDTWTDIRNDNSSSDVSFWQMGNSFVKGEWIRTLSEPEYSKYLSGDGDIVISVKVKGKARALETSPIKLKAFLSVPFSGTESYIFKNGNRFTLHFMTPVEGFVSVYLADKSGSVARLLPYSQENTSCTPVKAMERYEFFTSQEGYQEQYTFETDKSKERNIVYVLFSTKEYVRPFDRQDKELDLRLVKDRDFMQWISELRSIDKSFQFIPLPVEIISD